MPSNDIRNATGAKAVTPSNTTVLEGVRALYVGGAGNVAVKFGSGDAVTLVGVPAGAVLPIQPDQVMSTNTTASNIVALF